MGALLMATRRQCPADHQEKADRVAEALDWSFLRAKQPKGLRLAPTTCLALPGTREKEEVMKLRVRNRFLPCHPQDASWADFFRLQFTAPVAANGRIGEHVVSIDGETYQWAVSVTIPDEKREEVLRKARAALESVAQEIAQDLAEEVQDDD